MSSYRHTSWDRITSLKPSASNPPAPCETQATLEAVPAGQSRPNGHPLDASEGHEPRERLGQPCAYLRVKLASIVQEGHADFLEAPDFTGVVLETLKHTAAHVSSAHKTVLDLSCREKKEGIYINATRLWSFYFIAISTTGRYSYKK